MNIIKKNKSGEFKNILDMTSGSHLFNQNLNQSGLSDQSTVQNDVRLKTKSSVLNDSVTYPFNRLNSLKSYSRPDTYLSQKQYYKPSIMQTYGPKLVIEETKALCHRQKKEHIELKKSREFMVTDMKPKEVSEEEKAVQDTIKTRNPIGLRILITKDPELVHASDQLRVSAQHWAVKRNDNDIIDYLIFHGANVFNEDSCGRKPSDLAKRQGHTDTYVRLMNRMDLHTSTSIKNINYVG